jgi:hypothetical protein
MAYARARALRVEEDELAPPRRTVTITGHPGTRRAPAPRVVDLERRRSARAPREATGARAPREATGARAPREATGARSGHVVDVPRRRPRRTAAERIAPRPDRLAMWALMMALFLVMLVAVSPHG